MGLMTCVLSFFDQGLGIGRSDVAHLVSSARFACSGRVKGLESPLS